MDDTTQPEDELRAKAEEMVEAKLGFKRHLMVYVVINAFLFAIWLITALVSGGGAWFPWFVFVLVGWGIGVVMHGYRVYYGEDDAKRKKLVNEEMERMREAKGSAAGEAKDVKPAEEKVPPAAQD
jgi:fatty acid desaturase